MSALGFRLIFQTSVSTAAILAAVLEFVSTPSIAGATSRTVGDTFTFNPGTPKSGSIVKTVLVNNGVEIATLTGTTGTFSQSGIYLVRSYLSSTFYADSAAVTVLAPGSVLSLTAPVIARDGEPTSAPFSWTIQNDSTYYAGMYWNVQRSDTVANLNAGNVNADVIQQVAMSDLFGDPVWFDKLGSTPIGPLALRMRIGYDTGEGISWSAWSNVLTDTIVVRYTSVIDNTKLPSNATISTDKRTLTSIDFGYNNIAKVVNDIALSQAIGYAEVTFITEAITGGRAYPYMGLVPSTWNYLVDPPTVQWYAGGMLKINNVNLGDKGSIGSIPGTVGLLVHKATGKFWIRTSGGWYPEQPSFNADGTIATGTGFDSGLTSFLLLIANDGGDQTRINCGQDPFVFPRLNNVPEGWA